jgi:hypothetical protein
MTNLARPLHSSCHPRHPHNCMPNSTLQAPAMTTETACKLVQTTPTTSSIRWPSAHQDITLVSITGATPVHTRGCVMFCRKPQQRYTSAHLQLKGPPSACAHNQLECTPQKPHVYFHRQPKAHGASTSDILQRDSSSTRLVPTAQGQLIGQPGPTHLLETIATYL